LNKDESKKSESASVESNDPAVLEELSKKAEKKSAEKAKRVDRKERRVAEGVAGLKVRLIDLVAEGIASLESKPASFWDQIAARLIDAQAPGLANRARRIGEIVGGGPNWTERVRRELGRLALLVSAFDNLERLPEPIQWDVKLAVGWTLRKEEVAEFGSKLVDVWRFVGMQVVEVDRMRVRYDWLIGRDSKRSAQIVQFAVGANGGFEEMFSTGVQQECELAFWPGVTPQRARIVERRGPAEPIKAAATDRSIDAERSIATFDRLSSFVAAAAETLSKNPFLEREAGIVANCRIQRGRDGRWRIVDERSESLSLGSTSDASERPPWPAVAAARGRPVDLALDWSGETARVLGVYVDDRYVVAPLREGSFE
jgi:hypothetical protein